MAKLLTPLMITIKPPTTSAQFGNPLQCVKAAPSTIPAPRAIRTQPRRPVRRAQIRPNPIPVRTAPAKGAMPPWGNGKSPKGVESRHNPITSGIKPPRVRNASVHEVTGAIGCPGSGVCASLRTSWAGSSGRLSPRGITRYRRIGYSIFLSSRMPISSKARSSFRKTYW